MLAGCARPLDPSPVDLSTWLSDRPELEAVRLTRSAQGSNDEFMVTGTARLRPGFDFADTGPLRQDLSAFLLGRETPISIDVTGPAGDLRLDANLSRDWGSGEVWWSARENPPPAPELETLRRRLLPALSSIQGVTDTRVTHHDDATAFIEVDVHPESASDVAQLLTRTLPANQLAGIQFDGNQVRAPASRIAEETALALSLVAQRGVKTVRVTAARTAINLDQPEPDPTDAVRAIRAAGWHGERELRISRPGWTADLRSTSTGRAIIDATARNRYPRAQQPQSRAFLDAWNQTAQ
jgi:hypothetical protein